MECMETAQKSSYEPVISNSLSTAMLPTSLQVTIFLDSNMSLSAILMML